MKMVKEIIPAICAVAITMGVLWSTHRDVAPKTATREDVAAEAVRGGYRLIGTEELWGHYQEDREKPFLVDTRQDWEFRTGHIKGAVSFPMEPTWLSRLRNRGALEAFLGPDRNRLIVFY